MGLFCGIVKTGVVIAVIGGGLAIVGTSVLGHDRLSDLFTTAQSEINDSVDTLIDERQVLEKRVEEVRETYPKEISALRTQLKDAERAYAEADKNLQACATVMELAQEDIAALAFAAKGANSDDASGVIRFNERLYAPAEAHALIKKSEEVAEDYRLRHNRLADEKEVLSQQITLLGEEVTKLKSEWESFEAQYRTIQRQLDQIERNEKIIELTKSRTYSRPSAERKKLTSLAAIQDRIEKIRMQQEEELQVLRQSGQASDYETRAKVRIASESTRIEP